MAPATLTSEEARRAVAAELTGADGRPVRRLIAGVTGPPGAGKSTFASGLVDELNARSPSTAAYLPMDGFHLAKVQLDRLGARQRRGAPDTFDVDGYRAILTRLTHSYAVADVFVPDFDRRLDDPVAAARVVPARARVVVTEGNYLALATDGWAAVRPLLERLYYVDALPDVRRRRLLDRHTRSGLAAMEAQRWVDTVDEPNARLIAATRPSCDTVLLIRDGSA
ncbi:nucleoside/nucleotide kinase family protein [Mycobacterium sp. NPDC050041]|uniref:nucleoside/nucleotide kinase family protein n=1 Tax=Mycobacterium sp. NPDC050041 TaxID=3364293 RepID=UPI003C2FEC27